MAPTCRSRRRALHLDRKGGPASTASECINLARSRLFQRTSRVGERRAELLHGAIVASANSADTCAVGGLGPAKKASPFDRSSAVAGVAIRPARHAGARLFAPEIRSRRRP